MREKKTCKVVALTRAADMASLCKENGVKIDKWTGVKLIGMIMYRIGPHFGYKVIEYLMKKDIYKWYQEDFEVEQILDRGFEKGEELYLVKWKGWDMGFNTWEPVTNLKNCAQALQQFKSRGAAGELSAEPQTAETRRRRIETIVSFLSDRYDDRLLTEIAAAMRDIGVDRRIVDGKDLMVNLRQKLKKNTNSYKEHVKALKQTLSAWQKQINSKLRHSAPVHVENLVDLEGPPDDFTYIHERIIGPGVVVDQSKNAPGCRCSGGDCVRNRWTCCGVQAGHDYAYKKPRRLRLPRGHAIFECSKNCSCRKDCFNRVVQHGRKVPLCIFRTGDGRGWGVKAVKFIPKGVFVEEYVGEVITWEEAEKRGQVYDMEGLTYLFDLDYHDSDCAYTIDAKTKGNVSHFINHSCDPNLAVFNVWIDNWDERLPRIALFSVRDIMPDEEITFDYKMNLDNTLKQRTEVTTDDSFSVLTADSLTTPPSVQLLPRTTTVAGAAADNDIIIVSSNSNSSDSFCTANSEATSGRRAKAFDFPVPKPGSSPVSAPPTASDLISGTECSSTDATQRKKYPLRSIAKRASIVPKFDDTQTKTEKWVRFGGTFEPSVRMPEKVLGSTENIIPPAPKRYRMACTCGAKTCKKFLC